MLVVIVVLLSSMMLVSFECIVIVLMVWVGSIVWVSAVSASVLASR